MDHYVHYVYHYPADRHSNLAKLRQIGSQRSGVLYKKATNFLSMKQHIPHTYLPWPFLFRRSTYFAPYHLLQRRLVKKQAYLKYWHSALSSQRVQHLFPSLTNSLTSSKFPSSIGHIWGADLNKDLLSPRPANKVRPPKYKRNQNDAIKKGREKTTIDKPETFLATGRYKLVYQVCREETTIKNCHRESKV